jgi:hypothetical protein
VYAAIRQAKAKTGTAEELTRRIKEGVIPIISDVEGFMAHYVIYAPDDSGSARRLLARSRATPPRLQYREASRMAYGPVPAVFAPRISRWSTAQFR